MSDSKISPAQFATFGDLLKYLRRKEKLTQIELSIAVGYSDTHISRLEQNQQVPDSATITALFLPALHIDDQSEWAIHLLDLAAKARKNYALKNGAGLEIKLLGKFDVRYAGKPVEVASRPAQSLFAYLVLSAGTFHRREKLAGLLWPDSIEESARDNLRHALWRVRKALQAHTSTSYLQTDEITIAFDSSAEHRLDVAVLEKVAKDASADELIAALTEYEGELLPGFYDEWVLLEREHLNSIFEHHMARLMSLLQKEQRWLDILAWGERWIKFGQKPEPAYQALMSAHAAKGDMSKVAAIYERCTISLKEIGVAPSEQTKKLYGTLIAGNKAYIPETGPSTGENREDRLRSNVPIPLTSFIGREIEVGQIVHLVEINRLLTLIGPGGIGKTRLAIQSANKLRNKFKDGIIWVDLAGLRDEAGVPQALAQALNVHKFSSQPIIETIVEFIQSKQLLLVLDNCEHLITACAQLADFTLSRCNNLKILATSRETLDILGENVLQVSSLSIPADQNIFGEELKNQSESVQLFLDRSIVIHPQFKLSEQNAKSIVQICRRLSGMPLAIELAAARVKMMSVEEIAKRLDDRFNLLTTGNRSALPRQQTLQATIGWSYDLLTELEKIFFRRISVFANGFTLKAAEEITAGVNFEKSQVVTLLSFLINKSLITANVDSENSSNEITRYGLLETIREYAYQKLIETGEASVTRDRHLGFFMRLAEEAEPEILLSDKVAWFNVLEQEIDNIRAALEWCTVEQESKINDSGFTRYEAGLRLAIALTWFWERDYRREAIDRLKLLLAKMDTLGSSSLQTKMLNTIGFLYWSIAEFDKARSYLEKAVSTGRQLENPLDLAWALNYLGTTAVAQGDQTIAQACLEEAFQLASSLKAESNKHIIGWALAFLGDVPLLEHDYAKAQSLYEISVMALGEVGNKNLRAYPIRRLGYLALYRNDYKTAIKYFKESMIQNRNLRHQMGMTSTLSAFGRLAIAKVQYIRAAKLFGAVEANLEVMRIDMFPTDHLEYSHSVTLLKNYLDENTLTSVWAEGHAMTLEQAVVLALEE